MRVVKRGFTLVELLVVIAIIALLLSVLIPSLNKAREAAKKITCASSLRQLGLGILLYVQDHRQTPGWGWQFNEDNWSSPNADDYKYFVKLGKIWPYVKAEKTYLCNSTPRKKKPGMYGHTQRWWGWGPGQPRWTYVMNSAPGYNPNSDCPLLPNGLPDWGIAPDRIKPNPTNAMMLFEQNMGDYNGYDNSIAIPSVYNVITQDPMKTWTSTMSEDTPAFYHGGGSNLAFYDGRVQWEMRRKYLESISTPGGFLSRCGPNPAYVAYLQQRGFLPK